MNGKDALTILRGISEQMKKEEWKQERKEDEWTEKEKWEDKLWFEIQEAKEDGTF